MNENQNNKLEFEDQLANFTDLILSKKNDKKDESAFAQDPELRALEETVLRLKNTFSEDGPSEAVIRRMQKNINREWQQQKIKARKPFWEKWFPILQPTKQKWQSQRSRQRWGVVINLTALILLMLVSLPLLNGVGLNQPAASGQTLNVGKFAAIAGVILLAVWFFRRKS
jgi:Flp pilus assembly protein TadB